MSKKFSFLRHFIPLAFVGAMAVGITHIAVAQEKAQQTANVAQQTNVAPQQPTTLEHTDTSVSASVNPNQDTVKKSDPYGLSALWSEGDMVSRITLLIMAVMSIGSWYVIIIKIIDQNRTVSAYKEVNNKNFWKQGNIGKGADLLSEKSPYRMITKNGIEAVEHHKGTLQQTIDLYSWVSMSLHRSLDQLQGNLQKGLAFLGTVGSTAPFVGLFGTVWGIHHALSAISIAGQATLDKVAGPVGEALIMTAIGLATAVPAVLGYNFLVRRNKVVMDQARNFTADVQCVLIGGNPQNNNAAINKGNADS